MENFSEEQLYVPSADVRAEYAFGQYAKGLRTKPNEAAVVQIARGVHLLAQTLQEFSPAGNFFAVMKVFMDDRLTQDGRISKDAIHLFEHVGHQFSYPDAFYTLGLMGADRALCDKGSKLAQEVKLNFERAARLRHVAAAMRLAKGYETNRFNVPRYTCWDQPKPIAGLPFEQMVAKENIDAVLMLRSQALVFPNTGRCDAQLKDEAAEYLEQRIGGIDLRASKNREGVVASNVLVPLPSGVLARAEVVDSAQRFLKQYVEVCPRPA